MNWAGLPDLLHYYEDYRLILFYYICGTVVVVIAWKLDLQLPSNQYLSPLTL
jgi:hypothetical protein